MKKKLAVLAAGICALSLFLTGCSGEISNDYVTITKYKGVEIDKVDADAVSDNDVEAQINSVLQSKSTTTEVTDRAAQTGDTVTIDYEGKKDGVAFDGGTANNYELTIGSGTFIDGFEDGIIGMKKGQTKDLDLTFPEEYSSEELAGQEVVFKVTLQSFKRAPELTDDWAAKNTDCKTAEDYKKEIRKTLEEEAKTSAQNTLRETAWNTVLSASEVKEYPQDDLDTAKTEFKTLYENYAKQGDMTLEDFVKAQGISMDDFEAQCQQYAQAKDVAISAVWGLVMGTVTASGIPEAIAAAILVLALGKVLVVVFRKMNLGAVNVESAK